ncbi:Fe-S oxidoreductase [Castellaniella defragrans 65Phen]|uniref:Fe-S oxidoreductase n=1 Tax=Castellaniella defragrans (strain DSM 12143 / CCUG 39792 / 65Phen) TaxID=1437824 RepID=W8X5C0_CASD6|nr:heterodisulfide reductase-related iron-sulfur binding cluster [Castellaniella defragrans]CDM25051.1 Fe-S oxidoreductase [Castellaniella defragrans 65Phen]
METRELFWALPSSGLFFFYVIGIAAMGAAVLGVARSILKYARGRASPVPLDLWRGVRRMVADMLTHRTVRRRDRYAGMAHAGIFFGFVLLFIGTSVITLDYDIVRPLFGVSFWKGGFFLVFSLVLDLAGVAVATGLAMMMVRRARFGLPKLNYLRSYAGEDTLRKAAAAWRIEDWIFLSALLVIVLTGFLQEGVRHAMESPSWAAWEPVGRAIGGSLRALGLDAGALSRLRAVNWWVHGVAALAFVATIPWYKAKHMIAALGSLASRDPLALRRLPKVDPGAAAVGVGDIAEFSWKDMLDLDACTKCGRCHEACPARTAGYPLSPRDFILDLRLHNDRAQSCTQEKGLLEGGVIHPDTLWACRMCGACLEICPVGVEHPVKILQMRRRLVENDQLDPLLRNVLNTIGVCGNSFGEPARKRGAWTAELEFHVKDIRKEPADSLWFVGDQASFDPRNQRVSRTVARLLKAAGFDFGLLYDGERTAGNDVRRVGEEGLFESLVEHNLDQMARARPFQRIFTTDPHGYNTLRNEYPEFGRMAPVLHYTEVLCELFESGALKAVRPLGLRVTYHDPCHLGRLNKVYEAPRRLLGLIGCELVEMPRHGDNSFCCGAGGGRFWIPDQPGAAKPSELRMREAAELGIQVFATCCPKDLTMFEDARKTAGLEEMLVVEDIAELVARAIDLEEFDLRDLPVLMEKIADSMADRVMVSVQHRLDAWLEQHAAGLLAAPRAESIAAGEGAAMAAPAAHEASPPEAAPWRVAPVEPVALPGYQAPAKEGLRIVVPIKQIGKLSDDFRFSGDGRTITPESFEYLLNEWDDTALEQALLFTEQLGGGEVVVVSVGAEEAEDGLRKALGKGAHRGVRIWGEALAGADPITIARVLAGFVMAETPDLVIAGAQSGDLAQGSTGIALARLLDMPSAALVVKAEWDGGAEMVVTRELEGGVGHRVGLPVPALVTMQTGANTPRYATMRMIKLAKAKPILNIDVGADAVGQGAALVHRLVVPEANRAEMLEGSAEEVASRVIRIIQEKMGAKA